MPFKKDVVLLLDFDGTMTPLIKKINEDGTLTIRSTSDVIEQTILDWKKSHMEPITLAKRREIIEQVIMAQPVIGNAEDWKQLIEDAIQNGQPVAIISFNKFETGSKTRPETTSETTPETTSETTPERDFHAIRFFLQHKIGLSEKMIAKIIWETGPPSHSEKNKNRRIERAIQKAAKMTGIPVRVAIFADDERKPQEGASELGCHVIKADSKGSHLDKIKADLQSSDTLIEYHGAMMQDKENASFFTSNKRARTVNRGPRRINSLTFGKEDYEVTLPTKSLSFGGKNSMVTPPREPMLSTIQPLAPRDMNITFEAIGRPKPKPAFPKPQSLFNDENAVVSPVAPMDIEDENCDGNTPPSTPPYSDKTTRLGSPTTPIASGRCRAALFNMSSPEGDVATGSHINYSGIPMSLLERLGAQG